MSSVSCLVIRCNQKQFEAKEIFSYLRIKAKLSTVSAVMLAVEDAGRYSFYILRDLFYFRNVSKTKTDKPFTIKWTEHPEPVTQNQLLDGNRWHLTQFFNSDRGLDSGYMVSELQTATNVSLTHCQRFFVDPETTVPRNRVKRVVERNPFLKSATVGEIIREMNRRGYEMTYAPKENSNEKDGNGNGSVVEGQSAEER
ncbi:hypothetical protein JA13_230 [Dickeya phage vB_DsoM_JA13]|uniref:Uncharacterized protein n=1 Tax=Dickeya phage vB_DsoM_JA13 TaxID=2283030 RepID=A0A384ZWK1_9CAUD|nr:hypothetical protein JA13_230 [Dickeya phage vB_DsoM_JA13]